jgi:hypothetical protein
MTPTLNFALTKFSRAFEIREPKLEENRNKGIEKATEDVMSEGVPRPPDEAGQISNFEARSC